MDIDVILTSLGQMQTQYAAAPETLTFDLLTLKLVSESRVTWATLYQF